MNEYLDQREMEALLQDPPQVEQEEIEQEIQHEGIRPYDLTSPMRVMSGRMLRLENVNRELAHQLRVALSGTLQRLVEVQVSQPQTINFSDFLNTLPMPASLHLFRMMPLRGTALLAFEPKLVFTLIDTLLGGSGKAEIKTEGHHFTPIECQMILRVVHLTLEKMVLAWRSLQTIYIEYERSETNPQFAKIVPPTEVVVMTTFEVKMDDAHGNMTLCMPYAALLPLRPKLYAMTQDEPLSVNSKLLRRIQQHVRALEVEARVEIGSAEMSIGSLLHLQVGDIIRLEKDIDSELLVKIETVPKFRGLPCKRNQQKALQITSRIRRSKENGHE